MGSLLDPVLLLAREMTAVDWGSHYQVLADLSNVLWALWSSKLDRMSGCFNWHKGARHLASSDDGVPFMTDGIGRRGKMNDLHQGPLCFQIPF